MTKKQIEAALEKLAKKREELHAELKKVNAKVLVECVSNCYGKGCGKKTSVGKLTYIATYYYDNEPYCEGWVEGEGQFDCPRCGHRNRIIDESLGGVGERIKALRDVFKKTVKSHDDSHPPPLIDED